MLKPAKIELLDHGYLQFVESWGSDERIIEAARMSTNKGFLGWGPSCSKCSLRMVEREAGGFDPANYPTSEQRACQHDADKPGDERLLKYLYDNRHSTPFEMAGLVIEVSAPIMVFREWHRHRTQSYNEMSARYVPLPNENYLPTVDRLMLNAGTNKQAQNLLGPGQTLPLDDALRWLDELSTYYQQGEQLYQRGLALGVPKELARLALTVGRYSRMRASANLRNWLHFLTLRMAPNAQWEIRQYANAVSTIIQHRFPRTHELFIAGQAAA